MLQITDPLSFFKYHETGPEALRRFQAGAVLYRKESKMGSPREWLQNAYGSEFPSDGSSLEEADYLVQFATPAEVAPAVKKQFSEDVVQAWVIDHDKLAQAMTLWERAQECAAEWNACAGTFSGKLTGLSKKALLLLNVSGGRRFYSHVDMEPAHLDALNELNQAGLLKVYPGGRAYFTLSNLRLAPLLQKARLAARMQEKPHAFLAPGPEFRTFDPMDGLTGPEGKKVLDLYKKGAQFNIWRWSSPHNRWLEKRGKQLYIWETDRTADDYRNQPSSHALVAIGRRVAAEGVIPYCGYGTHRDGGLIGKEVWAFDQEKLDKATALWDSAQQAAARWNTKSGFFNGDFSGLSEMALSALRLLRTRRTLPMHPELFPVLTELSDAGFLRVQPEGLAYLVVDLNSVRLPKGPVLKIVPLDLEKPHPVTGARVERMTGYWHSVPPTVTESPRLAA